MISPELELVLLREIAGYHGCVKKQAVRKDLPPKSKKIKIPIRLTRAPLRSSSLRELGIMSLWHSGKRRSARLEGMEGGTKDLICSASTCPQMLLGLGDAGYRIILG